MRRHGSLWGIICCCAVVAGAVPAAGAAPTPSVPIDVRAAPLSAALRELAREARVELLFDEALVRNLRGGPVRGRLTVGAALSTLLAGTGVGYRITADGAFVLFRLPPQATAAAGDSDGAIAEILVVGRRTQNADIRRTENDIQAYKVTTRRELAVAQHDNIDQFMRGRIPANAQLVAPAQNLLTPGSNRSAIDLRGIGAQRTLVLIDGRRIPSLASGVADFEQGDLNGIPLGAIERIETLTSTAGGIYGPSAIGGVVNIVLRRDYRGADVTLTSGITDRGDAGRVRLEGRLGFTPDGGATDVMLFASYARSRPLYVGQRDYAIRARRQQFENDPVGFVEGHPTSNSIAVFSLGGPLTLDPAFGGATLSSGFTYLPLDFAGSDAARTAALVNNSGKVVLDLPAGRAGELTYVTSNPRVASGLLNVRHRFTDRIEAYVDGVYSHNRGQVTGRDTITPTATAADAPTNPFAQPVYFTYPAPDYFTVAHNDAEFGRLSAGAIVALSSQWRATADYSVGRAVTRIESRGSAANAALFAARQTGLTSPAGLPAPNPLGGYGELRQALAGYSEIQRIDARLVNHFRDATLRIAGPVVDLAGGPLTLTLLGEARREHIPTADLRFGLFGQPITFVSPTRTQSVRSGYAELRAPLLAADAGPAVLRGLELQLAARYDRVATTLPDDATVGVPSNDKLITVRRGAAVFTGGARIFPADWLMLRGSVATGELPPNVSQLQTTERVSLPGDDAATIDPKRGGRRANLDGAFVVVSGGSHRLRQEHGQTISLGAVLNPDGRGGPRVSADYSRIDTRREITNFPLGTAQLLAAEADYPGRVVRAPLTEADAALGYAGGRVLLLDIGAINAGRTIVEAVDFQFDWMLPPVRGGELRAYGSATWQPSFRRRLAADQRWIERIGYYDGPLEWRGNAGLQWTRGPTAVDVNLQYYDSYRVITSGTDGSASNAQLLRFQGTGRIPAQVYVDVAVRRRFEIRDGAGPLRVLEARLGVQNLLDHSPPIVASRSDDVGYSLYGDPRRRRFELLLTANF